MALGMAIDDDLKVDGMFLLGPVTVTKHENRKVPDDVDTFEEEDFEESVDSEDVEDLENFWFLDNGIVITKETWRRYKNEILPGNKAADEDTCSLIVK